jgi:hypothetical protein
MHEAMLAVGCCLGRRRSIHRRRNRRRARRLARLRIHARQAIAARIPVLIAAVAAFLLAKSALTYL